jgi:uncharacterized protein YegJ (DUF2314 family)
MNKFDEKMSQIFDIEPLPIKQEVVLIDPGQVDSDFEFARKNIRELAEKGKIAAATDHPRAYEVAATLIKNMSDINKDLLELQKKKRDLNPAEKQTVSPVHVDKAVFVGSTSDLIKQIKNMD